MSTVQTITVTEDETGLRLDRWFKQHFPGIGHGQLEKLLRTGQLRVDSKRSKSNTRLAAGQQVRVPPLSMTASAATSGRRDQPERAKPSKRDVAELHDAILFQDESVIAINKPAGLAVQGGTKQSRHVDAMLDALTFEKSERPRLVHRLDKDTSGVLLLARTATAARQLTEAFRGKETRKIYWALVAGVPSKTRGRIDVPLAKLPGRLGEKVGAAPGMGKPAVTLYQVIASRGRKVAWLALMPLTGRTHQLRAHCAAMGMPILGDGKYGGKRAFLPDRDLSNQLLLHAREIALPHPKDGTTLRVTAPVPDHINAAWQVFGFNQRDGEAAVNELATYAEGLDDSDQEKPRQEKTDTRRENFLETRDSDPDAKEEARRNMGKSPVRKSGLKKSATKKRAAPKLGRAQVRQKSRSEKKAERAEKQAHSSRPPKPGKTATQVRHRNAPRSR